MICSGLALGAAPSAVLLLLLSSPSLDMAVVVVVLGGGGSWGEGRGGLEGLGWVVAEDCLGWLFGKAATGHVGKSLSHTQGQ